MVNIITCPKDTIIPLPAACKILPTIIKEKDDVHTHKSSPAINTVKAVRYKGFILHLRIRNGVTKTKIPITRKYISLIHCPVAVVT